MLNTYSFKFDKFYTKKFTFENINFKEREFYSFWDKAIEEYVNTLPNGLQKLKVRNYISCETISDEDYKYGPFGLLLHGKSAYFTGKIRVRYHIKDHKNFGVDLYLNNYWGGYEAKHLKEFSPFDFDFYVNLLFEKISYYSKETITFFMEIDFPLEGKIYRHPDLTIEEEFERNLEFERDSYSIAIYR